jgi:hypothetical protein
MCKKTILIIFVIFLSANNVLSDTSIIRPLAIYAFAKQRVEVHDKYGHYIRSEFPIFEYRQFSIWDDSYTGWAPEHFDVYAILENSTGKKIQTNVIFEIFVKAGKIIKDENAELTDYDKSTEKSEWLNESVFKKIVPTTFEVNDIKTVKAESFDLLSVQEKLLKQGLWPFFIRIDAYTESNLSSHKEKISYEIKIVPGD